jgi:dihydrofolate synthase / folylpolyglutamate synthase
VTFRQAEEYLLGLELFGMRFGLDRMHKLMTVLGLPQRRFASIHVVGTNGKSSTARFCAAILARHGLRAGSYTSPHLGSFRERIEVEEEPVSEADFAAAVQRAAHAAELVNRTQEPDDGVTQFEALTAASYHELARRGVEVAVIEAGLGGRFDATNVIPSKVQVLTSVGLEHTRWLGPTLTDIADEKLAVVRDGGTLVVGDLEPGVFAAAQRIASQRRAKLLSTEGGATFVPISRHKSPHPPEAPGARPAHRAIAMRAPGHFQRRNFALAAAAAAAFLGRPLDPAAVERAGAETRIPGRLDVVGERPLTVYDGAHNPEGARALADSLDDVLGEHRPRVAVIGVLEDKDAAGMLDALLPHLDRAIFTRSSNPRSLPPATLATLAEKISESGDRSAPQASASRADTVADPRAAVDRARALAGPGGAVLATGSIYLVADLVREQPIARASIL